MFNIFAVGSFKGVKIRLLFLRHSPSLATPRTKQPHAQAAPGHWDAAFLHLGRTHTLKFEALGHGDSQVVKPEPHVIMTQGCLHIMVLHHS